MVKMPLPAAPSAPPTTWAARVRRLLLAAAAGLGCVLAACGAGSARAQESEDTFFDQEDFNTCAAFLAAASHPGGAEARRYRDWADGYLTSSAEDGALRRYNMRTGTEARAVAWLDNFCKKQPLESFRAAVSALAASWRGARAP